MKKCIVLVLFFGFSSCTDDDECMTPAIDPVTGNLNYVWVPCDTSEANMDLIE